METQPAPQSVARRVEPRRGYSIRVASRLTAIPAETLRMWERRYGFPSPTRDPGGVRLYTDADVERLRLVARALKAGYRVGEVIDRDLDDLVAALGATRHHAPEPAGCVPTPEDVVEALADDDVPEVRSLLRRAALTLGPRRFVADFAGPLCVAVGDAWAGGRLAVRHEHLLAACLSSQLRLLLSAFEDAERAPLVLLSTLPGEMHALGLEMAAVYLAAGGAAPRLAGPDLPPEQIADAARALGAAAVGISVSLAADGRAMAKQVRRLARALPRSARLWLGGAGAPTLEVTDEVLAVIPSWSALDDAVAETRR